jgi:putative phosphotransacetylase
MKVKVEVSNRHIHLNKETFEELFGKKFKLSVKRELSQKGEFASNSTLTIKTDKATIENVRVVGPLRNYTQVELSRSDAKLLGLKPPVRNSGDLENSESITLVGSKKEVKVENCVIIANRHMHINDVEAKKRNLKNNQKISANINNRKMDEIYVKVGTNYTTALHIDKDDEKEYNVTLDTWADINRINKKLIRIVSMIAIFLVMAFTILVYVMVSIFSNYTSIK